MAMTILMPFRTRFATASSTMPPHGRSRRVDRTRRRNSIINDGSIVTRCGGARWTGEDSIKIPNVVMSGSTETLQKLSAAASKRLGIPEDVQFYSPWPFSGMNRQNSRTALEDQEFSWIENFLLTGKASFRTLWDIGTSLYTAPQGKTVIWFAWFNIGPTYYVAIFLNDGTAVQVQQSNGAVTAISSMPGTFYNGGQLPFACQSGAQYLLICNNLTPNDYWIWDGTTLYQAGTIGPAGVGTIIDGGSGYTSVPSYTVYGGSGSGVVLTPVINEGAVVQLTVDNPGVGYLPGEIVQVAFSGGGSDTTPILEAVLSSGVIQSIVLISGGSGYTNGTFALGISGGGGSGAAATFVVAGGIVTSISLTSGGSGYTASPILSFAASAGGTGAAAQVSETASSVTSVTIVNGGTNLTGIPLLTIAGGGGTGATAVAAVTFGAISSVTVSNGGTGYTSTPAVESSTGLNNAAAAILSLMPFGVSGTCIETFLSRIWISAPASNGDPQSQATFLVSAPESLSDFSSADGGLLFNNSDKLLRVGYTALHQSNGYLYPLGDSSVDVISNVQTAGSPLATSFNYQNTSAQVGAAWRDSVQDFGQAVLFANQNGVQGLYGGSVRRVSGKINDIFVNAFTRNPDGTVSPLPDGVLPSGAVTNLFTIPVYLLLLTLVDPNTQAQRNIMVGWDERNWIAASQSTNLTFIGTQEQNSVMTAWGTDGNGLYPLFSQPSNTLKKTLVTKLYGGEREMIQKNLVDIYYRATDKSAGQAGVALTTVFQGTGFNTQIGTYPVTPPSNTAPAPANPNFLAPIGTAPSWGAQAANMPGTAVGATITTTSPDVLISGISMAYTELAIPFG